MKNRSAKVISALMIATALLGFASVIQVQIAKALPPSLLYVDTNPDGNFTFFTNTTHVGDTFLVNVTVANVTNFVGIQFTLSWDHTLLNCTSMTDVFFSDPMITLAGDMSTNIWAIANTITYDASGYSYNATYAYTWLNKAKAVAHGYYPANITCDGRGSAIGLPAYIWPEGNHGAAELNFTVIRTPTKAEGSLSCPLHLSLTKLGDPSGAGIAHTDIDGSYMIVYALPTTFPYFSVVPATYTATHIGQEFNISVYVNNLDAGWEAVGFQFKLWYNSSMLNEENVYPDPWMLQWGAPPDQGVLNLSAGGGALNWVGVGEVVLPNGTGYWTPPFPHGTGAIAKIQFIATAQNIYPAPDLTCALHLNDTLIADHTRPIPAIITETAPVDGVYTMKSRFVAVGRVIDIFTQWPAPYGGQGPDQNSDMFWPQKEICLYANVTYNGWPEQQKDVAFSIVAPNGHVWGIIYARTNSSGIASTLVRLPWPCDNPEQWFGVWTITGTVDIACVIVTDTLHFHYDYLVRIWKVTVDPSNVNHIPNAPYTITVNVTYGTYLWQDSILYMEQTMNATNAVSYLPMYNFSLSGFVVTATGLDNTSVPFDFQDSYHLLTENQSETPWHYCEYRNYTITMLLTVPKFARAGPGEVDVALLDNFPYAGGTVQSGYFDADVGNWLPYCPVPIIINAA